MFPTRAHMYMSFLPLQVDTIDQFTAHLTPTYTAVSANPSQNVAATYLSTNACPYDTNPTKNTQGFLSLSNKHVPGPQDSTTWNRFFWVIQYAVGQVRESGPDIVKLSSDVTAMVTRQ